MKVLIADDSAASRIMLRGALLQWGYEVVVAENGAQAWEILAQPDAPPMAILDWVMPYMTGPEVCHRVREKRREPYTYIILLTSKESKEETVEGLEAGADDYVVKPFNRHELQVRLRAGKRIIDLQMDLLRAREELRERANKDLLTMLPNRPAIASMLEQELARCHRDRRTVGVILLDVDHFKKINDTHGHFAGDAVLRETAARLRGNMRPYDQVGRYGGEEFLVVLPNCELEQAAHQAERMRTKLQSSAMMIDGVEVRVSASFGVTVSDGSERDPEVFVRVADEALYRAKASGRNCVVSLRLPQSTHAFAQPEVGSNA
ncbi:MAG: diguanylate cyclase [Acidobacteriaceae bacterium]|nr:diguanylate cyclase [Acidobacteriaceae bacterium]MBV9780283.1 diguanylate cyclase [Acidobacteriaceae bacterium]